MSGDSQPKNSWAQGNFNDGITAVADPTPGTSPEDGTLHSQDVAAGGGHSRDTLDTAQPGSLEQAHQHIPGACGPIIEQASEDVLAIGDELYDESPPVEKLGTGEQASMFSLNLSASCKPRQNHEVTPEETRKGSLEEAHQHTPGACDSIIEQASEDLLAIGNELYDESPPVEKLGTGEQASMFSLNLSASRKPRQNHVPAYEVTPEETRKALKMIRSSVEANPNALGISLIVSHQDVHPDIAYSQSQSMEENRRQKRLNSLEGIEHGAQQLEEAFTMRGLTVVRLVNPTKKELFAVIRAMTLDRADPMAIEYPASYQYFFFYTTGHGANKVFFTKDGSISYQEVYDLYQGFLHQRYFFFDCCRSNRLDSLSVYPNGDHVIPPCPDFSLSHNNRVIFATLSGHQACGPQGEGVSFMTKKMVVLLKKQIPMDKVLARLHEELPKEVKEKTGQFQQVMNVDSTPRRIDLWQEQKQALKPKLQVTPHLSPDSAVVYHTVEFPPPTTTSEFHQQETLQFQMKSQSGAWINLSEYKETSDSVSIPQAARPRASTTTTASQPSYVPLEDIASYERGRDLVHSFRPGHSNSNQQATNVSQVTRVLKIPVSEVGIRVAEFRVVSKLNGGLELESNTVLGIVNLVQPVICKSDSVIEFEGSQEPQVSISWSIRQVPLTISYLQFIVCVYKKGDPNPVLSEDIDFEPQKEHYKESFDMPGLSDDTKGGDYLVVVEAKRADGQTVCSERIPLETAKGCCYHLSLRCLVGFVFFFLFGTAIITLLSSMIGTNTSEKNEHRYNASAMLSYTTLGIPTAQRNASFFNCLLHFDYKNEQVIKHKDIDLYCGQFTKFQLANSRTPKFWGPNDIAINQRNKKLEVPVDFLPIGSTVPTAINLLPRSIFSVYLCLSAPVDGTIVFQLYRYEDLPHIATSEPLQRNAVTFERSTSCNYSSNTSINVLEHNLVIGALSTNSTAHPEFTRIQGYVQQYYYDEKHLGLINDTYLVGDQPKTIPGSIETELVCYANGDRSRTVFLHLFSVLVPTALTLWKVIVIATTALVLVVAFIFCVFRRTLVRFVCNQYRQCRQRCGHNSYTKLNN